MSSIFLRVVICLQFTGLLPLITRAQEATISETTQTFRTYPFSDPDPVARMGPIYPYFRFHGYSSVPEARSWKVVTLENAYIRVLVAPELGGKVIGAMEKSTGREFLYYNHVVKFRDVALRGPWTSGGIEFNFGILGHTPTTATPVDYLVRKNRDGSVSCFVGALDLPSRTEWRVEISLPADRALFETRSFWFNPTEQQTSFYQWTNAAVPADSTLQVIYPGTAYIGHAGETHDWPIDHEGRDLTYYRNNDFGSYKSYHVLGSYTDYFGARWGDFGVIHWSPYIDKPGKKLWIWGLSREGMIWVDLLTDTDLGNGQYSELQSGIHFNQAIPQSSRTPFKNMQFLPQSSETFTESWFPFVGIGAVSYATPHLALETRTSGKQLHFGISPTERVHDTLEVVVDGRIVYTRQLRLSPLETFRDSILLKPVSADYEIRLGSLVRYRSADEKLRTLERPIESPSSFDWESAYGYSVQARELERHRDYDEALQAYKKSLQKEPDFSPSLCAVAELMYRRMQYDEARDYARHALAIDAYDPRANYVYALAQRKLNRPYDARDGFGLAARSSMYRSSAYVNLAELAFLAGSLDETVQLAERVRQEDSQNVSAHQLLALIARLRADTAQAHDRLDALLELDPLNHFARFERYRLEGTPQQRDAFTGLIRNELPQETYLELASFYLRLDLFSEADLVLSLAPEHPIVALWRAYCADRMRKESGVLLKRALASDPTLVFPHRVESAEILRWAQGRSPGWKTDYYLALIYWDLGRTDEALELFDRAGTVPAFAPFYLARASIRKDDPARARVDLERALQLAPGMWRTHYALTLFLNAQGRFAEALAVSAKAAGRFPDHTGIQFLQARTLILNGQYDKALKILDRITILPAEATRDGRDVYRQACMLRALEWMRTGGDSRALGLLDRARLWPEHLGSGKPYNPDSRLEDYLEAVIRKREGDKPAEMNLLSHTAEYSLHEGARDGVGNLLGAIALRSLGRTDEGEALLRSWIKRDPAGHAGQWSLALFNGEKEKAQRLEEELRSSELHPAKGDQEFIIVVNLARMGLLD